MVATAAPGTTLVPLPLPFTAATTTQAPAVRAADIEGFPAGVRDGRTVDFQVGPTTQLVTLAHITVADVTTCEGSQAKQLLAAIIIGHRIRLDHEGIVWRDDLDVAQAMVAYGMAKASDGRYARADGNSVDVNCANTTSTTRPPVVSTRPKPTAPRPRPSSPTTPPTQPDSAPAVTEPAAAPAPPPTQAPG